MFAATNLFYYFQLGFSGGEAFLENVKKNLKSDLDLKEKQMSLLVSPESFESRNLELRCKFVTEYRGAFVSQLVYWNPRCYIKNISVLNIATLLHDR